MLKLEPDESSDGLDYLSDQHIHALPSLQAAAESRPAAAAVREWPGGEGEMAHLIREFDWSRTPIGPIETWSAALRMVVTLMLANRFPMILWWGPQFCQFYNDPYRPIPGGKHPQALGQVASECWSEIWHVIGPLIETPFRGGPATWMEDIFLEIHRHGFVEETHFTIAYSPVPDDTAPGGIGGVLATVHEISGKVIDDRRVMVLRDLGARSTEGRTAEDACAIAAQTLRQHDKDIPFALFYLIDADRKCARLAGASGVEEGAAASPSVIELGESATELTPWPLGEAMRSEAVQTVTNLAGRLGPALPGGPWSDPPHTALVLPIPSNKAHFPAGFLVAGTSARLQVDELYRSFLDLVVAQVATAIANARDYEEERKQIRQSEERFRLIVSTIKDYAIFALSLTGEVLSWNEGAERLKGYQTEEILGRNFSCFYTQEEIERETPQKELQTAREQGSCRAEGWRLRKNGTLFWADVTITALYNAVGELRGFSKVTHDITDRKRAEEALRESESKYRAISELIDYGVWICSPDGRNTYASESFLKLVGLTQEQCSSFGWRDVLHPDDSERAIAAWKECVRTEGKWNIEHRFRGADGKWHPVLARGVPVRDEQGRITCWAGINLDISDLKEVEEALRASEKSLRESERRECDRAEELATLLDAVPLPVFIGHDPDCLHLTGNPMADEILRIPHGNELSLSAPEETRPHHFRTLKDGRELRLDELPAQRAARGAHVKDLEFTLAFDDGMVRHVLGSGTPLLDDQGRPRGTVAVLVDITERKRAEEALLESRAKLQAALASMTDSVFISDVEGRFVDFNEAFAAYHRFKNKDECLKTFAEYPQFLELFMANGDLARLDQWPVWRALRGEVETNAEYMLHRKDTGEKYFGSYSFGPIRDKNGAIVGAVVTARDITERKRAEEALRKAKDELELRINERTAELSQVVATLREEISRRVLAEEEFQKLNEQLEQRVRERTAALESANKELEAFTYSVSHDLRAPLRHVDGFSKLLIEQHDGELSSHAREYLGIIRESVRRMGLLIDDLLDLSRLGRRQLAMRWIGLNSLVDEVKPDLDRESSGREIEWRVQTLPFVECDPGLIKQVFANLLSNALKFTRPRTPAVIEVGTTIKDGAPVVFVRDNGVGFNMKYVHKLFGVFQRLHGAAEFEGTGVGLATVQRIIQKHGGRVWAEAELDKGATFYFTLGSPDEPQPEN